MRYKQIFYALLTILGLSSMLRADWDYKYLPLEELIDKSDLIVIAEIKTVEEKIDNGRVIQSIVFKPITNVKGTPALQEFKYHASFIPNLCAPPESQYLTSPPGTKYLLFLIKRDGAFVSVLGPCGALRVSDYLEDKVFWYTDESEPQRFSDHWKEKPLSEVIASINKKQKS